MLRIPPHRLLAVMILLSVATLRAQNPSVKSAAPDSTLFTTYTASPTSVNWVVCGSTPDTEGCYASGSLGPFVGVGAMLEGDPFVKSNVVTRKIYVARIRVPRRPCFCVDKARPYVGTGCVDHDLVVREYISVAWIRALWPMNRGRTVLQVNGHLVD